MIKSCWKPLALSVLTLSLLSACGEKTNENHTASNASSAAATAVNGPTVTINTARGEITVPENPSKVVVFDMATLDDLQALKVPVIGAPKKCWYRICSKLWKR